MSFAGAAEAARLCAPRSRCMSSNNVSLVVKQQDVRLRRLIRPSLSALGVLLGSVLHAAAQLNVIPADRVCSHSGLPFVGPCRTVHGDVVWGADNIHVRIYPSGTKRILGYADGALRCNLPKGLEDILTAGKVVEADVTIRPVTFSRPDVMQFVCIASVRNVRSKR